ncbi:MAG: hypothetical protein ACK4UK_01280 [Flavobacterium sp.]
MAAMIYNLNKYLKFKTQWNLIRMSAEGGPVRRGGCFSSDYSESLLAFQAQSKSSYYR